MLFQFPFHECRWDLHLYDIQQFEDIISAHKDFHIVEISQLLLYIIAKVNWSQIISYENPERIAFVNQFTVNYFLFVCFVFLITFKNISKKKEHPPSKIALWGGGVEIISRWTAY